RVLVAKEITPVLPAELRLPGGDHAGPGGVVEPDHRGRGASRPGPHGPVAVQHGDGEPGPGQLQRDAAAHRPGADDQGVGCRWLLAGPLRHMLSLPLPSMLWILPESVFQRPEQDPWPSSVSCLKPWPEARC